jgi:hypothetical protein
MMSRDRSDRFAGDAYRIFPQEIADDVVRRIAISIRLQDPEQTAYLKEQLAQVGGRYRRWRRQEAVTPRRRDQLDRLRRLQSSASRLVTELARLEEDVKFRIGLCHPPKGDDECADLSWRWQVVDQLSADLLLFKLAAKRAIVGASKRGPRLDVSLYLLVEALGKVYTKLTGESVTHNPYDKTLYRGTPQSVAGRFILAAAKAIDSGIRSTAVNTAVSVLAKGMVRQKPPIK